MAYEIVSGKGYKKMNDKTIFEAGKYQTLQLGQQVISRLRESILQKLLKEGKLSTAESGYLKALSDVEDVILSEKEKIKQ
ncbi:hypothetical protein [Streptococcus mutans]|uniref:hypothetical protein n=1 Tax=Streptococcus mutans TaxID=1309 RepID=UPI00034B0599|nr:hypothetical protein [Streptococcus mutans]